MNTPEALRLKARLLVTELAERAGVAIDSVSRIERGDTKNLRPLLLDKIGAALQAAYAERGQEFHIATYIDAAIERRDQRWFPRKQRREAHA